jgi:hypothetical protein
MLNGSIAVIATQRLRDCRIDMETKFNVCDPAADQDVNRRPETQGRRPRSCLRQSNRVLGRSWRHRSSLGR